MNRAQQSQLREILLQLTDLKNRIKEIYWGNGTVMSTHEEIALKKTLAGIEATINNLTEVI